MRHAIIFIAACADLTGAAALFCLKTQARHGLRRSAHIFAGSKAPWFTITDDLPRYDGHMGAG